jgi:hypothetical protein
MFTFERRSRKIWSLESDLFLKYRSLFVVPNELVDENCLHLYDKDRGKIYTVPSTRIMEYIDSNEDQFDLLLQVAIMEARPGTFPFGTYEIKCSLPKVLVQVLPVTKQAPNQLCILPISLQVVYIDATDLGLFE